MLVGQAVIHRLNPRHRLQNLLAHNVHRVLHARAVLFRESLECNLPRVFPRLVEALLALLDLFHAGEALPVPAGFDFGAQDAVPGFGQAGVLVAVETPELRAGALQHEQALDSATHADAFATACYDFDGPCLCTIAHEGVRVRLAINLHARPAVHNHAHMRGGDVRVGVDVVLAEDGGEELWRVDGVELGGHVRGLLLGVGGDDVGVVGVGPRGGDVAFEKRADGHFGDILGLVGVALDFVEADVVFAIAGGGEVAGHDCGGM